MLRKRKAISEIISVMTILLIVSIAGVVLYNISLSTIGAQQDFFQYEVDKEIAAAQERFEIIGIEYVDPLPPDVNGRMEITIYNFSPEKTTDIIVDAIYVNDNRIQSNFGQKIASGSISSPIVVSSPVPLVSGLSYKVSVVSTRGVGIGYIWKIENRIPP